MHADEERGHLLGVSRGRVQAARHLRLPLRADEGAAGGRGARGRRPGLRGADGRGAPRSRAAGVRTARAAPTTSAYGLRAQDRLRDPLRRLRGDRVGDRDPRGRARERPRAREARGEPVLRRGRRPGLGLRRRRDGLGPRRRRGRVPARRRPGGRARVGRGRAGRGPAGARRRRSRDPLRDDVQPHRDPSAARRRCASAWARTSARRGRTSAPTSCGSTSRTASGCRSRSSRRSRRR